MAGHRCGDRKGKKVCFISPSAYPLLDPDASGGLSGGAETQLCTIGRSLSSRGYDVHFIVDDYGQPDKVAVAGMTAHRCAFRYMGGSNLYVLPDWMRLYRLLGRVDADYHLVKVPRHILFLLGIFCRLNKRYLVFIGQKDSDLDESVIRSHEGAKGWWLFRKGMELANAVVAQTEFQRRGFAEQYDVDATVIPNVLTLDGTSEARKGDYVLWVGNSTEDKRPHLVVELARALPHIRFRMIMAMAPTRPNDDFIRSRLPEVPNLDYLGHVPFSEISEHYQKARLFISTSRCEGFPNTFLQAWQFRTPVVSLNVDPDSVIERYRLGRLSGTFERMIEDIRDLYDGGDTREELGRNAYRYAHANHSLESATTAYVKLFRRLDAAS